jgi:hypothetical protein
MTSATTTLDEVAATNKPPLTRLLDLLAGWSAYLSADEESGLEDPALSAEDIGGLYQAAGQSSENWQGLSEAEQEKAVRVFVNEQIIPLLLHGRPGKTDAES